MGLILLLLLGLIINTLFFRNLILPKKGFRDIVALICGFAVLIIPFLGVYLSLIIAILYVINFLNNSKYKFGIVISVPIILILICFLIGYKIPWFDKHPEWGTFPEHQKDNFIIESINDSLEIKYFVNLNKKTLLVATKKENDSTKYIVILNYNRQILFRHLLLWGSSIITITNDNKLVIKETTFEKNYISSNKYYSIDLVDFKIENLQNFNSNTNKFNNNIVDLYGDGSSDFHDSYKYNIKNIKVIGTRIIGNKLKLGSAFQFHFNMSGGNSTGKENTYFPTRFINECYEYFELNIGHSKTYFKLKTSYYDSKLQNFYQFNYPTSNTDTLYLNYFGKYYRIYLTNK